MSDVEAKKMPSPRRSSRRRTVLGQKRKISYRERTDEEDEETLEKEQSAVIEEGEDTETENEDLNNTKSMSRGRSAGKREPARLKKEEGSDDGNDSDGKSDLEDAVPPAAAANPPRHSPRKSPKRTKLIATRRRKVAVKKEDGGSDEEDDSPPQKASKPAPKEDENNDGNPKDNESEEESPPAAKKKKPATSNSPSKKERVKSDLTCPYCDKTFAVRTGFKYHIDNYVCRKDQKPVDEKKKKKKKQPATRKRTRSMSLSEETLSEDNHDDSEADERKPAAKSEPDSDGDEAFDDAKDASSSISEKDEDEDYAPPPKKKTRAASAKRKDDGEAEAAADLAETPTTAKPKKRASTTKKSKKKDKRFRGGAEDRTCPKCKRVFTSIFGKDYHCVNRVCEQKLNKTDSTAVPFATLQPGLEFVTREYGVVRVIKDDRETPTAPALSKQELDKFRIWKNQKGRLEARRREQYVSSTIHSLTRRKRFGRLYLQELKPKPLPHTMKRTVVQDDNRLQREIRKIYTGTTTAGASTGDQPADAPSCNFPKISCDVPVGEHPLEPEGSYPDRIVECVQIPDQRKIVDVSGVEEQPANNNKTDNQPKTSKDRRGFHQVERQVEIDTAAKPMKLFLKRRLLTEPHMSTGTRFRCVDCGKVFASMVGCKYHVTTYACHRPATRSQQKPLAPNALAALYEHRSSLLMERQDNPDLMARTNQTMKLELGLIDHIEKRVIPKRDATIPPTGLESVFHRLPPRDDKGHFIQKPKPPPGEKKKWLPKKKREWAFYPQVWRSLGFKVVPKKPRGPTVSYFKNKKKQDRTLNTYSLETTMKSLTDELVALNSESLGAYYPEVWKVLRFRKPSSKPFKVKKSGETNSEDDEDEEMEPLRAKRPAPPPVFVPQPPPAQYGPAVVIDVSVLASEVDSGRYPSMKRNNHNSEASEHPTSGDELAADENKHDDQCYICRDSRGILYLCDFCHKVNHLLCIRTRFLVKEPEPHDDFMCHKCIQYILQRRRRAEKRRQRRTGELPPLGAAKDDTQETNAHSSDVALNEPAPEHEFDNLARQQQNVDQIMELLKDAQARLQLLVETSKMNEFRRSQFDA